MKAFREPSLNDLLSEDVVIRLMQRDRVRPEYVRALMGKIMRQSNPLV